jgi:23S rRNA (guanosine2251-2'-O)-methyltransferase
MAREDRLIFGIHPVLEAIQAGREVDRVMVRRGGGSEPLKKVVSLVHSRGIPLQQVPVEKLNRMTSGNHQGVVALLSAISYTNIEILLPSIYEAGEDPLILLLDGVSDVRNFGAIARSAECAGAHAVVISVTGSAAVNADAIRTSAGALNRIPVCRVSDLKRTVRYLRESGLRITAASEKSSSILFESDLSGPAGIIMGSEERGISAALMKEADQWVSIPMAGNIASLNVSVAAGIILFEAVRQRQIK